MIRHFRPRWLCVRPICCDNPDPTIIQLRAARPESISLSQRLLACLSERKRLPVCVLEKCAVHHSILLFLLDHSIFAYDICSRLLKFSKFLDQLKLYIRLSSPPKSIKYVRHLHISTVCSHTFSHKSH